MIRSTLAPLAIAASLAVPSFLLAQMPAEPPPAPPPPATLPQDGREPRPSSVAVPLVDLQLDQPVSVQDYVDYLTRLGKANIVLLSPEGDETSQLRVPRLKLTEVPVDSAVRLLSSLPDAAVNIDVDDNGPKPTYIVTIRGRRQLPGDPLDPDRPPAVHTQVYSLERMFLGESPGTQEERKELVEARVPQVLQVIEQALQVGEQAAKPAEIKLHEASHTLIVRGTPEQLGIVEQCLNAFAAPEPRDEMRAQKAAMEDMRRSLQMEKQILQMEVEAMRKKLQMVEQERLADRDRAEADRAATSAQRAAANAQRAAEQEARDNAAQSTTRP